MLPGDIMGHEMMGEVVEVGSGVTGKSKKGDRIVGPFTIICGECDQCKRGNFSVCERTNRNKHIADKVFGHATAGLFGQMAICSAMLLGANQIIAIDRIPERLSMAEAGGATTITFEKESVVERLNELTDGKGPEKCIGRGRLFLSAIEQDTVKVRNGDRIATLVQDKRLRWPEQPHGTVYIISFRNQDMSWFEPETGSGGTMDGSIP